MLYEDLRLFRSYCGFTQEQVAEVIGVDRSTYASYEHGETEPDFKTVEKLAKLYNVTCDRLLNGLSDNEYYCLRQKPADNMYESEEVKNSEILKISSLSDEEKQLILMFRSVDNREKVFEIIRNSFYD